MMTAKTGSLKQIALLLSLLCCACLSLILVQEELFTSSWPSDKSGSKGASTGVGANEAARDSSSTNNSSSSKRARKTNANHTEDYHEDDQNLHLKQAKQQQLYRHSRRLQFGSLRREGRRIRKTALFKPKSIYSNRLIDRLCAPGSGRPCDEAALTHKHSGSLLNLSNVTYPLEPARRIHCYDNRKLRSRVSAPENNVDEAGKNCDKPEDDDTGDWTLLIVVNSKWSNFERRAKLRSSWLNEANIREQVCIKRTSDSERIGDDEAAKSKRTPGLTAVSKQSQAKGQVGKSIGHQSSSGKKASGTGRRIYSKRIGGEGVFISRVEYAFVLGLPPTQVYSEKRADESLNQRQQRLETTKDQVEINGQIRREWQQNRDLLLVNLPENYHSMSLKHLALFKWILKIQGNDDDDDHAAGNLGASSSLSSSSLFFEETKKGGNSSVSQVAKNRSRNNNNNNKDDADRLLVLKCDDDAQVNLDQLVEQFLATFSPPSLFPVASAFGSGVALQVRNLEWSAPVSSNKIENIDDDDDAVVGVGRNNEEDEEEFKKVKDENGNGDTDHHQEEWPAASTTTTFIGKLGLAPQSSWIMCAQFPENSPVLRNPARKWRLHRNEYQFEAFPAYCSGLAYLTSRALIRRLFLVAHLLLWQPMEQCYSKPLWIDDVFVTGILMASLAERPKVVALNSRFCYTKAQQSRGLRRAAALSEAKELPPLEAPPWPCMVSELLSSYAQ